MAQPGSTSGSSAAIDAACREIGFIQIVGHGIAPAVVDALMRVQLDSGVPVFSVALTPHNFQPTEDLLGFFRNHFVHKGEEAADACAQTLAAHAAVDAALHATQQA